MNIPLKSRMFKLRAASYAIGFLSFAALAGLVSAKVPPITVSTKTSAMDKIVPRYYMCHDHNVRLPVTYIETAGGNFYAVLQVEGKQISMTRQTIDQPAAQDGKNAQPKYYYLSLNEQDGYRWYPEGDGGKLSFLAADDSAKEQIVYQSCRISKNN